MNEIWTSQKWPPAPPGFMFLAPAFNLIGNHLFPGGWDDAWGGFEMPELPPQSVYDADETTRAIGHRVLMTRYDYSPDYEEAQQPPLSAVSALETD